MCASRRERAAQCGNGRREQQPGGYESCWEGEPLLQYWGATVLLLGFGKGRAEVVDKQLRFFDSP